MTNRLLIGYTLLVFLLAGGAAGVWLLIRTSPRNVRRRERRRARHARAQHAAAASDENPPEPSA